MLNIGEFAFDVASDISERARQAVSDGPAVFFENYYEARAWQGLTNEEKIEVVRAFNSVWAAASDAASVEANLVGDRESIASKSEAMTFRVVNALAPWNDIDHRGGDPRWKAIKDAIAAELIRKED